MKNCRCFFLLSMIVFSAFLTGQRQYLFEDTIKKLYPKCYSKEDLSFCSRAEWELSFSGLIKESQTLFHLHGTENRKFPEEELNKLDSTRSVSMKKVITDSAKNYRVIIMNETHHDPVQRAMTFSLLDDVYAAGYRYLGCEGLDCSETNISELNKKKYVSYSSGYFIQEPTYANMINYALKKGFYVFGYDACGSEERELGQAKEIAKIFERDSAAKMLLHVGWGHLREDSAAKVMAFQFRKLTGIDPFTVNQTRMRACYSREFENPIYQKLNLSEPLFFFEKGSGRLYHDNWTDVILFLQRPKHISQRPDYLVNNPRLYKFKLEKTQLQQRVPCIITVQYNDDVNAVPTDVIQIKDLTDDVYLFSLQEGKNRISIRYKDGKTEVVSAEFR